MGFWSGLADVGKSALGSLVGGVTSGIGSSISDRIEGLTPPLTGAQLGLAQRDYMDAAFPGTNPWERLGQGSANTPIEVAKQQRQNLRDQLDTQRYNVQTQTEAQRYSADQHVEAARISADANKIAAAIPVGPDAVNMVQGLAGAGGAQGYETQTTIAARNLWHVRQKLDSESAKNFADAALKMAQRAVSATQEELNELEIRWKDVEKRVGIGVSFKELSGLVGRIGLPGLYAVLNAKTPDEFERALANMERGYGVKSVIPGITEPWGPGGRAVYDTGKRILDYGKKKFEEWQEAPVKRFPKVRTD